MLMAYNRRILKDLNVPWLLEIQSKCQNEDTCTSMRVGDEVFLCRAHGDGRPCSARNYIFHAMDDASSLLSSPQHFPTEGQIPRQSRRLFVTVCKQLARVFSHMYQHHHELFTACEAKTSLYARFKKLVQMYELLPDDTLPN